MIYNKTYSTIHLLKGIWYTWIREKEIGGSKYIWLDRLKIWNKGLLLQVVNPSFSMDNLNLNFKMSPRRNYWSEYQVKGRDYTRFPIRTASLPCNSEHFVITYILAQKCRTGPLFFLVLVTPPPVNCFSHQRKCKWFSCP